MPWRPATANDIGKKCRVRDSYDRNWHGGEETRLIEFLDGKEAPWGTSSLSHWRFCEVWDEPRTEITWENIGDRDVLVCDSPTPLRVTNGMRISFGILKTYFSVEQRPKPKTVITEAMMRDMILDKYGLTLEQAEIRLD